MSKEEQPIDYLANAAQLLIELNNFRKNPQSAIEHLEKLKTQFKENVLYRDGELPVQTNEGVAAVEEAIESLRNAKPLPEFELDDRLTKSAQLHVDDIGPKGLSSHEGSNGSSVSDRIELFCEWEGVCAENIDFGSRTAINVLLSFLADDGVSTRGHRVNLLNQNLKKIGIAAGPHKEYDTCYVLNLVGNTREKDKPYFDKSTYKYQYPEDLNAKPEVKPKKIKNQYQLDDPDAPDDTVSVKTVKQTKLYNGKVHKVTRKLYTLADGTTTIVEVEDF
jgi:uncharacterized protein YkwD